MSGEQRDTRSGWRERRRSKTGYGKALHKKKRCVCRIFDQFGYEMYDDVGMIRVDGEKIEQAVREAPVYRPL